MLPAPNAGSPSSLTSHDSGSQKPPAPSCVIDCTLTSAMPARRNWSAAHAAVFAPDGKPAIRPQIWPLPTSRVVRLSFAMATSVSRSLRMVAPWNSGAAGSPGGSVTPRGPRVPTTTAGAEPGGGGIGSENHAGLPDVGAARRRPGPSSCARAEGRRAS